MKELRSIFQLSLLWAAMRESWSVLVFVCVCVCAACSLFIAFRSAGCYFIWSLFSSFRYTQSCVDIKYLERTETIESTVQCGALLANAKIDRPRLANLIKWEQERENWTSLSLLAGETFLFVFVGAVSLKLDAGCSSGCASSRMVIRWGACAGAGGASYTQQSRLSGADSRETLRRWKFSQGGLVCIFDSAAPQVIFGSVNSDLGATSNI
jgi:hypothetical protein